MQTPSVSDKQLLRKLDFPNCAREALQKVEQLCVPQFGGRPPSAQDMDLAMEIMAEFIFCEVDKRGNTRQLTCIQQLQLAQLLCDYFAGVRLDSDSSSTSTAIVGLKGDASRNTLFLSLFPPTTSKERAQALVQIVSMAISTSNKPVLQSTGIWMQQLGCTSKLVLQLAEGLVKDYFVLVPRAVWHLQELPTLAPHFTANFLATVAEMYFNCEPKDGFTLPPYTLLEVVTVWVADNPHLCLAALQLNLQPLLPVGSIPMAALTPFAGLFKWCVLSPLLSVRNVNMSEDIPNLTTRGVLRVKEEKMDVEEEEEEGEVKEEKVKDQKEEDDQKQEKEESVEVEEETIDREVEEEDYETDDYSFQECPLFSELHLALLESLVENVYPSVNRTNNVKDVVSAQHIAGIVEPVQKWLSQRLKLSLKDPPELCQEDHEALELALDRLGQAVQVALAANCAYGNKQYLLTQLDTLKHLAESRLLRIVLKTHQAPSLF